MCSDNYFAFTFSLFLIINVPLNFELSLVGVYPYDFMDVFERFEKQFLPSKERFYIFNKVEYRNLGDCHDLYITTNVLILADVF